MSALAEVWECPVCGFAFAADHQDIDPTTGEGSGNHSCPMCELAEKEELIASLQGQLSQAIDCAARWACRYHSEETRFQRNKQEIGQLIAYRAQLISNLESRISDQLRWGGNEIARELRSIVNEIKVGDPYAGQGC